MKPSSTPHPGHGSERFRKQLYAVLRLALREGLVEREVHELVHMVMASAGWVETQKRARERQKKLSPAERRRRHEEVAQLLTTTAPAGAPTRIIRGPSPRFEQTATEWQAEREIVARATAGLREGERLRRMLGVGLDDDLRVAQTTVRCVCGDVFAAHGTKAPHACRVVTRRGVKIVGDAARTSDGVRCKCRGFRRAKGRRRRGR